MQRRHALSWLAPSLLVLGGAAPRFALSAPQPGDARLLLVFLRGGYDASNVLVPHASSFYYEVRPNIAIAKPNPANPADANAAIELDAQWGLHPALKDSLMPLWQRGQLAFVPFAGTHDNARSHFETQDTLELGQSAQGQRDFESGFMNRLAGVLGAPMKGRAIAFTDQLPLIFRGQPAVPNMALGASGKLQVDQRQAQLIGSMYADSRLAGAVAGGFETRDQVVRSMEMPAPAASGAMMASGEMEAASRNAITARGFEGEARRIARVLRDQHRLGFVDVGGWDTHVGQGGATGALANRLGELGRGLAAFAQEMDSAWANTVVVVVSEFGRTFRENGNRGTDHGHGSVYWVMGGAVRGARVLGEQQELTAQTLHQNRDYPVLNEYRAVLGGVFARQFGLNPAQVGKVFAGVPAKDVGLV
jgi:uncharacterized protein (DUF1501 family)